MTILERVRAVLDGCKFSYSNEKQLQALIATAFLRQPVGCFVREFDLGDGDVIDFMVKTAAHVPIGLGIEVKTKEPPAKVLRQLERYMQHPEILDILLVTSVPAHGRLPELINGKPLHVYGLWGKF